MSDIFLYGEKIFQNLTKYFSPEIKKDEFVSMIKQGQIELNQISSKENFYFNHMVEIKVEYISLINIKISNAQNLEILINDIKCILFINDINKNQNKNIKKENLIELIKEFIIKVFCDDLNNNQEQEILKKLTIDIKNIQFEIREATPT